MATASRYAQTPISTRRRPFTPTRAPGRAESSAPAPARRPVTRAALRWQDATLPVVGRVRAAAWVPSILLAGCAVALVYLLQTSGVATTGYDIQRLESERTTWELRNEQLKLEMAKLRSLPWVESEAVNRLGMKQPEKVIYVAVNPPAAGR